MNDFLPPPPRCERPFSRHEIQFTRMQREDRDAQTAIFSRNADDPDVFEVFVRNTLSEFERNAKEVK